MRPLPPAVLQLLETLPEEVSKIVLNTNRQGHWEIEVFARYAVDEPPPLPKPLMLRPARKSSKTRY